MTRDGSFKRAARSRARRTGQKYTRARAAMERIPIPTEADIAVDHDALRAHLEKRYGIAVSSVQPFDGDHPLTFRVVHSGGAPWVARTFPLAWRPHERVEGDAEILRFLQAQGYPAERLAHAEPVSQFDGQSVIVTEFVDGARPRGVETHRVLGELLGRMHALPAGSGALAREGGAFGHHFVHEGRPAQDLAAGLNLLNLVQDKVAPAARAQFDSLREMVTTAETCDGLPEGLTHPNFHEGSVLARRDGERIVVAWSAAGRGARMATLAWLLWLAADIEHASAMAVAKLRTPQNVDAIVSGYTTHVRPTAEELDRLPAAMMMRSLYMACWYYERSIASGYQPSGGEGWWPRTGPAEAIAERALAAFKEPATKKRHAKKKAAVIEEYGTSSRATVLERYRRHADAFEALIQGTPQDGWDRQSPCEKWSRATSSTTS